MSLDYWFRLSGYLTLALSCAALVFAEAPFLPDLSLCLPPVLALLLLAWWVDGRWRLPNWGANILGIVIAIGGITWLATQLADSNSLLRRIPVHLALLPYMGPLLIAALLVKLFGANGGGDFWYLQVLGLMQIGLGCVLDGGPVFGVLTAVYFAAVLACLALRYRLSADPRHTNLTGTLSAGWLVGFTLRWTLLIAVPTLLLFLLTPRRDNGAWEPLNGLRSGSIHVQSGSEEINLNDTGQIELDDKVALQIVARDAEGRPKLDLPPEQRWRGAVLDLYENGKWKRMHRIPGIWRQPVQNDLPDFGPERFFLTFTIPPRQPNSLVLAEPIRLGPPSAYLPVVILSGKRRRLFYELDGSVLPLSINSRREQRYRQVVPAGVTSSRSSAEGMRPGTYLQRLTFPPRSAHALQSWTVDLLRRLSRQSRYRLSDGVRAAVERPNSFMLLPEDWESVARALCDYLATSGEFRYTLYLTRQDRSIDPVLDFLFNIKQGHCERFASALTLMLRSIGIPARVVQGFRGCESLGDGQYVVRHRHAHAWVEMLAPHRSSNTAAGFPNREFLFDWLELDPTPAESTTETSHFSWIYLWEEIQRFGQQGWQTLIVDYDAEEQADLWDSLQSGRHLSALLKLALAVPAVLALVWVGAFLRRLSRRRRANEVRLSDGAAYYQRLTQLLDRYASLRPSFGQTPREYSAAARDFLHCHPSLAALAELPLRIVDLFYRARFGGQSLSEEERLILNAELDRFAEALRAEPRP